MEHLDVINDAPKLKIYTHMDVLKFVNYHTILLKNTTKITSEYLENCYCTMGWFPSNVIKQTLYATTYITKEFVYSYPLSHYLYSRYK